MKRNQLILACFAAAAFVTGCNKDTTSRQLDNLQTKTAGATQDMKDYTFAQKAEFTERMQSRLAEINKDLDQLGARIEKSSDEIKAESKPKYQALREQSGRLNKQLDAAKNATESTWSEVKAGSRKAYAELKEGINQSRQWASDKIAP